MAELTEKTENIEEIVQAEASYDASQIQVLEGLEAVSSREYYAYVPGSNPGSFAADELTVPGEGYMLVSEMCHRRQNSGILLEK